MRAIVTGGAGFIGSHLSELLINEGHTVVAIDNLATGRLANLRNIACHPRFSFVQADIVDRASLRDHFKPGDWIFHLAGMADIVPSIERPDEYYGVNVTGTFNVLECARQSSAARFVYAASSSSYGIPDAYPTPESSPIAPQYPYALSKFMGEELVLHWAKVYRVPAVSLRMFNVYGTRSRTTGAYGAVFGVFLAQKLKGLPFTVVGDGRQSRDFTYVTDVARAFLEAARSSVSGEALNVGSGDHYSVNRLVELLGGPVVHVPKRPGEPDCTFADISKIQALLRWAPKISFEEGVGIMLQNINDWSDAPVWDLGSIEKATRAWFAHLGDHDK